MRRRDFLAGSIGCTLTVPWLAWGDDSDSQGERKRIAFLGTVVRRHSHAQHFLDRLTFGYAWQSQWVAPRVEVASVYIDQYPEDDLARQRIERHQLDSYPSIADALTLGGDELAVDGVVIIGEHGDYPRNEWGQLSFLALP